MGPLIADMDNFCSHDLGNQDDAYWAGCEDGATNLARSLLKRFFIGKEGVDATTH